jgi:hypothetical protein
VNDQVHTSFATQIDWCRILGSPLYAEILAIALGDIERGGPVARVVEDFEGDPVAAALPLRFMGGVHRLVLERTAERLVPHFPTVGGDPDGQTLEEDFLVEVDANAEFLRRYLDAPPQTNEIGRSVALFPGLAFALAGEQRPIRLLEIGSSAGLNLLLDQFNYQSTAWSWTGDSRGPLLEPVWTGAAPPIPDTIRIIERRGCDTAPVRFLEAAARRRLLSYVWGDQVERFERLTRAMDLAIGIPFTVDESDAATWLADRLEEPVADETLTVVQHSVMWQYLDGDTQAAVHELLGISGAAATDCRPLAHVSLEPPGYGVGHRGMELIAQRWPGDGPVVLGYGQAHGASLDWVV